MKINRLDAHDRFLSFQENQTEVGRFVQDMVNKRPWGSRHFYVFIIHKRSVGPDERVALVNEGIYPRIEDTPEAYMIMSCRVTKPACDPNTTLIRVNPSTNSDSIVVLWSLPQVELWEQFEKGKMFENEAICQQIAAFKKDPEALCKGDKWDPATREEFNELIMSRKPGLERRIPVYAPREEDVPDIMPEI